MTSSCYSDITGATDSYAQVVWVTDDCKWKYIFLVNVFGEIILFINDKLFERTDCLGKTKLTTKPRTYDLCVYINQVQFTGITKRSFVVTKSSSSGPRSPKSGPGYPTLSIFKNMQQLRLSHLYKLLLNQH